MSWGRIRRIVVTSEVPGRVLGDVDLGVTATSKPTVKVRMFGLNSRASATTAVESMPLERKAPTGTSERMCMRTLSRSVSRIRR